MAGLHKYTVQESGNAGLGQAGSMFIDTTDAASPPTGRVFVAITIIEDATFDASGGLIAEDSNIYMNTEAAAHGLSDGSETIAKGSGGDQIDASNTFPAGVTIYGRWTEIDLNDGSVVAYIG
jgi:hypothetical protein